MGKLIVIEGTDASGKETQAKALFDNLCKAGKNVKLLSFPNYSSEGCIPVKMYLNGELGENANDINPYCSSLLFTVDRIISYYQEWKDEYINSDVIFIADRYVTSNMVHQLAKLNTYNEQLDFYNNLKLIEYDLCKLPKPDSVIFLDMPPEFSEMLKMKRYRETSLDVPLDIHERDSAYLKKCYNTSKCVVAKLDNWEIIPCTSNGELRTPKNISEHIYNSLLLSSMIN